MQRYQNCFMAMLLQFVAISFKYKGYLQFGTQNQESTSQRATVRALGIPPSYKHGPLGLTKYRYPTEA